MSQENVQSETVQAETVQDISKTSPKIKVKIEKEALKEKKLRKKRTHKWTEANKKSFYEKCVPARKASLEAKKKLKEQSISTQSQVI